MAVKVIKMNGIKKFSNLLILGLFLLMSNAYAQQVTRLFSDNERTASTYISVESNTFFSSIDHERDIETLRLFSQEDKRTSIKIQWSEDRIGTFTPLPSYTMHQVLNTKFPDIFTGKGRDENGAILYFDYNPHTGFRAVIVDRGIRYYIDPTDVSAESPRVVYRREQLKGKAPWSCGVDEDIEDAFGFDVESESNVMVENEINKYRLAVATTSNYAQYHGGTISSVMAAIVNTVNRVNSVYEIDAGITLELVADNDQLIFLNSSTDPFNNNSSTQMISVNGSVINSRIGSNAYDIGHAFSTGAGGLATLQCVCTANKARGVTGLANPVGDPYDIDYVAHEIGHQFGATHTQNNSCQRSSSSAFEPFSASTIMGYAGICAPNLQNQSDDYFHHHSLLQMNNFAFNSFGNSCATKVPTGNSAPTITPNLPNVNIPVETPFFLSANVSDSENDPWTLVWEQYDLGPSSPSQTQDSGPIYRSFTPENEGTRYLPMFRSVALGSNVLGERLTFGERTLRFRATARDNHAAGGAISWEAVTLNVVGNEPFEVISPDAQTPFFTNAINIIQWDPGNTTTAPINCQTLDVYLSIDNARSFPFFLGSVPNTGFGMIYLPRNVGTSSSGRIMLKAQDGIFYNLSPVFSILDQGLDVEVHTADQIQVYPNPATDVLKVDNLPLHAAYIGVTNMHGQKVIEQINTQSVVDVTQLPQGVYLVVVYDQYHRAIETKRVVIQRM